MKASFPWDRPLERFERAAVALVLAKQKLVSSVAEVRAFRPVLVKELQAYGGRIEIGVWRVSLTESERIGFDLAKARGALDGRQLKPFTVFETRHTLHVYAKAGHEILTPIPEKYVAVPEALEVLIRRYRLAKLVEREARTRHDLAAGVLIPHIKTQPEASAELEGWTFKVETVRVPRFDLEAARKVLDGRTLKPFVTRGHSYRISIKTRGYSSPGE